MQASGRIPRFGREQVQKTSKPMAEKFGVENVSLATDKLGLTEDSNPTGEPSMSII
jgi:hypothetical protein